MAYRQPGVTVIQEFLSALPSLAAFSLPNVIVGPTFQVASQLNAGSYTGVLGTYQYPNQMQGTIIDNRAADPTDLVSYPVRAFLQNAIVQLLAPATTGAVLAGNLNQFTDATANAFANVQAGDVIVVTGALAGSYTVRQVINANTLQTNETFSAAGATLNYSVRRNVGVATPAAPTGVLIEVTSQTTVTRSQFQVAAGVTTSVGALTNLPVLSATVLVSYRALRFDKSADTAEYDSIASLQADFGTDQIVPENPAVFGAFLALENSPTPTNLLALPQDFLDTGSGTGDELIAYSKAFDVLALTDMYAIAVMTQSTSVHTALKAHVDLYSQPAQKLERIGVVNRQLVTTSVVSTQKADGATSAGGTVLTSTSATFITDGVVPGMFINIVGGAGAGRYQIGSVDSQTHLTVLTGITIPGGALTAQTFFIDKNLTKGEQAAVISAYAKSIADRRLVLTWPDVVSLPVGNVIRDVPGYFLGCAVVSLTTGLPTQQGLTNLSVAVFTKVSHSTKYFSNDDLNTIADGGVMIFVQDVLAQTALYVRHQLTTDRSAIKFQEYSVTKNVDFIAKFIRTNHKQFIGQYNIVDTTFDDLKTQAQRIIRFLSESTKLPKIGGVIRSGKLNSIVQDPVNIDSILENYSLDIPIPLNNLDITIAV